MALTPVPYDPFAPSGKLTPVDHDPFVPFFGGAPPATPTPTPPGPDPWQLDTGVDPTLGMPGMSLNPAALQDNTAAAKSALLRGAASIPARVAGAIPDLALMAYNAIPLATQGVNSAIGSKIPSWPTVASPTEYVVNAVDQALFPGATPVGDLPAAARVPYEAAAVGGSALVGGAGLAGTAARRANSFGPRLGRKPMFGDNLLAPYEDQPVRQVVQDAVSNTAAGASVGVVDTTPGLEDSSLAQFAAGIVGGAGGSGLDTVLTAPRRTAKGVKNLFTGDVDRRQEYIQTPDGKTVPVTNRVLDQAAKWVQGNMGNLETPNPDLGGIAADLTRRHQEFASAGLPSPTTGSLSDNIGLISMENMARSQGDQRTRAGFIARDSAVRSAAADKLSTLQTPGNPDKAVRRAEEIAGMQEEVAQRRIDKAAGEVKAVDIASTDKAAALGGLNNQKTAGDASTRMFETFKSAMTDQRALKNKMFDDPALATESVPVDGLRAAATKIRASKTPAQGKSAVPAELVADILKYPEGGSVPFSEFQQFRNRLATEYAAARAANDGAKLKNLDKIRDVFAAGLADVASRPTPGGAAAKAAADNYKTYAAKYVEGAAGDLKSAIDTRNVTPSKEGYRFLTTDEAAKQYDAVLGDAKDPAKGRAAARTLLLSQAAAAVSDGRINPKAIRTWRDDNKAVLERMGMTQEADEMVRSAVNGRAKTNSLAQEIVEARKGLKATEREIADAGLGLLIGADPRKAVGSVFSSRNPTATMNNIARRLGANKAAREGWKRAVADYIVDQVTNTAPASPGGADAVSFSKLDNFLSTHEKVLQSVLTADEVNKVRQVRQLLKPLANREFRATTGSPTAERLVGEQGWNAIEAGLKAWYGILEGGGKTRTAKLFERLLGPDDTEKTRAVVAKMMFDPELAAHLLTRDVKSIGSPAWNYRLTAILGGVEAAKQFNENAAEPEK